MKPAAVGGQGDYNGAGVWTPDMQGLLAANGDPLFASQGGITFGGGTITATMVVLQKTSTISNVHSTPRSPAGSGITTALFGVYDINGNLLGTTADQATGVTAATDLKAALVTPITGLTAGTRLFVCLLMAASTTSPTFRTIALGAVNHNLVATSPFRAFTSGSGLTALPSTITLSGTSSAGSYPWLGLS